MPRRTLALLAVATLTTGLLTACERTEDVPFRDGLRTTSPTPVPSAPITVPYPARTDGPAQPPAGG